MRERQLQWLDEMGAASVRIVDDAIERILGTDDDEPWEPVA